jgi:hypothetical protein
MLEGGSMSEGPDFGPILPETALALPGVILYKPGLDRHLSASPLLRGAKAVLFEDDASEIIPKDNRYGRSQTKNFALAAWHAPLG